MVDEVNVDGWAIGVLSMAAIISDVLLSAASTSRTTDELKYICMERETYALL